MFLPLLTSPFHIPEKERFLDVVLPGGSPPTHSDTALFSCCKSRVNVFTGKNCPVTPLSRIFPCTKEFVSVALSYFMSFAVPRPVG